MLRTIILGLLVSLPAFPAEPMPTIARDRGSAFAKLALKGIAKEYPHKPGVVWDKATDVKNPLSQHPAFYGCFDWHSAVHGHWMLVRVLKLHPDFPEAKPIREALGRNLTAENLKAEAEYFQRKDAKSFERPYGWTWLLKLAHELHAWDDPDGKAWSANLKPLAELIASRYVEYFPKQTYAIRSGVHSNTAFALARRDLRTLLVDLDPQGSIEMSIQGVDATRGVHDAFVAGDALLSAAVTTRLPTLSLLPFGHITPLEVDDLPRLARERTPARPEALGCHPAPVGFVHG